MIPYVELHRLPLGPVTLGVQSTLTVAGILVAHLLFLRRARLTGLDPAIAASLSFWMIAAGMAGGRLFQLAYQPELLPQGAWTALRSSGNASFGALLGCLLGGWFYFRRRRIRGDRAWRYLDAAAWALPLGWLIVRLGCVVVHDHPGTRSTSWLAVRYPDAPRHDLAVLEVLLFAIVIVPGFALLSHRRRPGFSCTILTAVYCLFRLAVDPLRVDPQRYFGLTVDQLAFGSALAICAGIIARTSVNSRRQVG
jgi:phosphatidylglycerol:prolipoprotein diacylglycerol transferase